MMQSDNARLQLCPQCGGCWSMKPNSDDPEKGRREGKASVGRGARRALPPHWTRRGESSLEGTWPVQTATWIIRAQGQHIR